MIDQELISFIHNCPSSVKNKLVEKSIEFGEKLLIQGQESNSIFILLEGKVKTYHLDLEGSLYIEDIDTGITIFGELEALINKEVVTTVEAISKCKVIEIENEEFLNWIDLDSKFSLYITKLIALRNYECCKRERVNAFYPLRYRVMYMILNTLYKNDITITKDLLVEGVGSNIRSINRIVNQLIEEDVLEYNLGIIKIKSIDKLINEIENKK